MPYYHYKAVTRDGEPDEGRMPADSAADVIARLQHSGLIPIMAEEIAGPGGGASRLRQVPALRLPVVHWRRQRADALGFMRSLSSLLGSSVALDRAFEIMLEVETDPATADLVSDVQAAVRGGATLSDALGRHEKTFSTFAIGMVRAAETSGDVAGGLERLTLHLEKSRALKKKVTGALVYPAILGIVAGLSVIILLLYVVPQFRPIFEEMGSALPLATRATLAVSDFLAAWGWAVLLTGTAAALALRKAASRPALRLRLDGWLLRSAVIGPLLTAVETARFSRSLATLLGNGVPVLKSLAIARETVSNRVVASAVDGAAGELRKGGELSTSLIAARVFPPLAIQLLKVGEETGGVDTMMLRVAEAYDDEVEHRLQGLLALLEPVLIIGLGIVIAGIIMSVLVGIISINDLPV